MKILFITHNFYPFIGGIEVNSEILATAFHKAGHEVTLITWTKSEGERKFPFKIIRNPGTMELIKAHLNTDLVFENNPSLRLSWPALLFGKPSVVALRTWVSRITGGMGWQDKLKMHWLKKASAVIAVSDAVRRHSWPAATVIGNPYREKLFKVLPDVQRDKEFVFMGRLVSDKGADIAIKAMAELRKLQEDAGAEIVNYSLTIIGSGPEDQHLKELSKTLGLSEQVNFTGAMSGDDLVKKLNEHRFSLVPSVWEEPFGNVALETMACGCLPIVSDGGGLPDAVGNAGLTFKRGDALALAQVMQNLINNKNLEQQLRDNAPVHLANHYTDVVSARYMAVIDGAINKSKKI
jgi:glycosyltransferase involved in cell wall biosynthesis